MSLHIRQKKNSSGSISIQIIDRVDRKYKVIETITCVKNKIDLEIYLNVASKRLEELNQQMYPTLFDENKDEANPCKTTIGIVSLSIILGCDT
jgi:hypothetical protein